MNEQAVGILGGTFDPVHYGHLRPALEVREQLGLDEVRVLPSARPPHRARPAASAEHRLEMLHRATAGQECLVPDDREIQREGPSYMVDTLAHFRREFGERTPLVLIIGQDAANGLDRWHEWRRLFELAHIAVMQRPDSLCDYRDDLATEMRERLAAEPAVLRQAPYGKVLPLAVTQLDISSTAIRAMVAEGRSPAYLTPPPVIEYIRENGLYSGSESSARVVDSGT